MSACEGPDCEHHSHAAERLAPGETSKPRNNYREGLRAKRLVKQRRARKLERKNRQKARRK